MWIPKVYHGKDKTFFFFSYEGFRNRNGAIGYTTTIPTPEMYNGDFSNWVGSNGRQIPIFDPTTQATAANGTVTRQPFAGNKIPTSLFSPLAVKALSVFGAGNTLKPTTTAAPGTLGYVTNNYSVTSGTNVQPVNKWSIKGDHIFNEKHRISGYYGYDRESQVPGPDGPSTLPGLYTNYNDLHAGERCSSASVGIGLWRDQIQPLLCGRQQLASEPQSAAVLHRKLEGQVLPARRARLQSEPCRTFVFNGYFGQYQAYPSGLTGRPGE